MIVFLSSESIISVIDCGVKEEVINRIINSQGVINMNRLKNQAEKKDEKILSRKEFKKKKGYYYVEIIDDYEDLEELLRTYKPN